MSAASAPRPPRRFPTDLTDAQWRLLAPLLPAPRSGPGRPGRPGPSRPPSGGADRGRPRRPGPLGQGRRRRGARRARPAPAKHASRPPSCARARTGRRPGRPGQGSLPRRRLTPAACWWLSIVPLVARRCPRVTRQEPENRPHPAVTGMGTAGHRLSGGRSVRGSGRPPVCHRVGLPSHKRQPMRSK